MIHHVFGPARNEGSVHTERMRIKTWRSTIVGVRRWFSGRMLACHAGGPGSIPGRRILLLKPRFLYPLFQICIYDSKTLELANHFKSTNSASNSAVKSIEFSRRGE